MLYSTYEPKNADQILNNMTEVKKSLVRLADTDDRLEYLRLTSFEGIPMTEMRKVKQTLDRQFSQSNTTFGQTWLF